MKIQIGREKLNSHYNWQCTNNTTTNIGFVQPTMMLETVPNGSYKITERTRIRLAPMADPPF